MGPGQNVSFNNVVLGETSEKVLSLAFFVCNTIPVATILGLAEKANVVKTWKEICLLTFPYFMLSAGVVSMAATAVHFVGWQIPLALFPVMALTYASYKTAA